MARSPLVSVVIRTFDRPEMLRESVRSAVEQTLADREILVVNDGGRDVSPVLAEFSGAGGALRHFDPKRKLGRCAAANLALGESRGKYVSYLDDDDLYHPDHLATLVAAAESSGAAFVYSDAFCVRQRKDPATGKYVTVSREVELSRDFDPVRFFFESYIHLVTVLHERALFESLGGFDESLPVLEDHDLFMRYAQGRAFHHVRKATAEYRIRDDGTNAVTALQREFVETREKLFKKYSHLAISHAIARLYDLASRVEALEAKLGGAR